MLILDIVSSLKKYKVEYAIAGGYAVALHGVARPTMDVDLVVGLNLPNLKKAEAALRGLGLKSKLPFTAEDIAKFQNDFKKRRGLVEWSFVDDLDQSRKVDILIHRDISQVRTVAVRIAGKELRVISPLEIDLTPRFNMSKYSHLDAESSLEYVENVRTTIFSKDAPTKLISIRVPSNILSSFKALAKQDGKKYQSLMVELMRDRLKKERQL